MSSSAETAEPKTTVNDGVKEVVEWVENDGRSFYIHRFMPADKAPVATLTIVHGLGEHIDRYEDLARGFVRSGIEVLGFDQRGFGKTGRRCGRLGDNEGIDCVACDISFMNKQVARPDIPHFLFGHSMGGLNVLNYTLNHNDDGHVRGVIASAPALKPGKPLLPPGIVVTALHQVARVFPSIQKNTGITTDMLTSNQSELEKFNASVENISHCTLGTLSDVIKRGEAVIKNAARFSTPVYLVHADGDKATDVQGTRAFYEAMKDSVDKQFREVKDNIYHELHFEEDLDFDLLDSYAQWILNRV